MKHPYFTAFRIAMPLTVAAVEINQFEQRDSVILLINAATAIFVVAAWAVVASLKLRIRSLTTVNLALSIVDDKTKNDLKRPQTGWTNTILTSCLYFVLGYWLLAMLNLLLACGIAGAAAEAAAYLKHVQVDASNKSATFTTINNSIDMPVK